MKVEKGFAKKRDSDVPTSDIRNSKRIVFGGEVEIVIMNETVCYNKLAFKFTRIFYFYTTHFIG